MTSTVRSLAAVAFTAVLFVCPRAHAATLVADYEFQDSLADSLSAGPTLENVGAGQNAFVSETLYGHTKKVLAFPQHNGVALSPSTDVIASDHYTIDITFRIAETNGYRQIVDLTNGDSDCGLYSYTETLYFFCATIAPSPLAVVHPNTWAHVALTRDSGGTVKAYLDGDPQISFHDNGGFGIVNASDTLLFFIDNVTGGQPGEDSAGEVAQIKLYDDALTDGDIASAEICGDANKNATITSSDALLALKGAVGAHTCSLAICDTTGDSSLTATDALFVLRKSVGQSVALHCNPASA